MSKPESGAKRMSKAQREVDHSVKQENERIKKQEFELRLSLREEYNKAFQRKSAELQEENERLTAKYKEAMRGLESLTPSGSEFVGDVKRCVEYIRNARHSTFEVVKKMAIQRKQAIERAAKAEAENERLKRELLVWENREASVCPKAAEAKLAGEKWVSVEERLPDDETWVIVCITHDHWTDVTPCYIENGKWKSEFLVTHWRPLPLPPTEGKEQNGEREK